MNDCKRNIRSRLLLSFTACILYIKAMKSSFVSLVPTHVVEGKFVLCTLQIIHVHPCNITANDIVRDANFNSKYIGLGSEVVEVFDDYPRVQKESPTNSYWGRFLLKVAFLDY